MLTRVRDLLFWTLGWRSAPSISRKEFFDFDLSIDRQADFDMNVSRVVDFTLNVEGQVTAYTFDLSITRIQNIDINICRMKEFEIGC